MKRMAKSTTNYKRKPRSKKVSRSTQAKRTKEDQNMFLNALIRNNYHITKTCEKTGISRMTYYEWTRSNPEFMKKLDELRELEIDNFEDAMRDLVEERNPQIVMFGLRTRGKHRGYVEKQEIEHTGNSFGNVTINIVDPTIEVKVEENKEIKDGSSKVQQVSEN